MAKKFWQKVSFQKAKNTHLKDINFEIAPGKNVLVTGPNGSGKSGLFRILGGLWPIPNGTIQKPGGNCVSLKDIYYVPQKPYNVTVSDHCL